MGTQPEQKHVTEAETVPEGDLKGSDFFPPGSGWNEVPRENNEAPREIRDLDLDQREKEAAEAANRG